MLVKFKDFIVENLSSSDFIKQSKLIYENLYYYNSQFKYVYFGNTGVLRYTNKSYHLMQDDFCIFSTNSIPKGFDYIMTQHKTKKYYCDVTCRNYQQKIDKFFISIIAKVSISFNLAKEEAFKKINDIKDTFNKTLKEEITKLKDTYQHNLDYKEEIETKILNIKFNNG